MLEFVCLLSHIRTQLLLFTEVLNIIHLNLPSTRSFKHLAPNKMAKTNRRKLKRKKLKWKRTASRAAGERSGRSISNIVNKGESSLASFLPKLFLILLVLVFGASFIHLTVAQTPPTNDDGIDHNNNNVHSSAITDNNNKISEPPNAVVITYAYKYAPPSSNIGKSRIARELHAKAKGKQSKLHAKAKAKRSKRNPSDGGNECNSDVFGGNYFYSGGCGGMSFNLNITCEHEDEELCKVQERSVS